MLLTVHKLALVNRSVGVAEGAVPPWLRLMPFTLVVWKWDQLVLQPCSTFWTSFRNDISYELSLRLV